MNEPFLNVLGLRKSFLGVKALDGVDFQLYRGQVHGLVGPNGAGKSTLIRVLAGVEMPDAGEVRFEGKTVEIAGPEHARRLGLNFIHQEPQLVHRMSVLENLLLGTPAPRRAGVLLDWRAMRTRARRVSERVGLQAALDARVADLGPAQQGLVAIARALLNESRVLILDEPTAMLTDQEIVRLNEVIRDLAAHGVGVIYVSHRLSEILELTSRVTVMRDGTDVASLETSSLGDENALVRLIAGQDVERIATHELSVDAEVALRVCDLGGGRVKRVSFDLHAGEVLGLTGLVGAGRTETARLIFGLDKPVSGTMALKGRPYQPRSPHDAIRAGVAYVPEDRRADGGIATLSVRKNLTLSNLSQVRLSRVLPLLMKRRERRVTDMLIEELTVRVARPDGPLSALSGGNQQKVVVGRALHADASVLILDEPTQGVDVRARSEIYRLIREMAADGKAILVISSDLNEVMELCPRVLVMHEGAITGDLGHPDEGTLLRYSYGSQEAIA